MAWRRRVSDQVTQQKSDHAETSTGRLLHWAEPSPSPRALARLLRSLRLLTHRFQSQLGRKLKEKGAQKRDPLPGPIPE